MKFTKKMILLFHGYPIKHKDLSNTLLNLGKTILPIRS